MTPMRHRFPALLALAFLALGHVANAQISLALDIKRRIYVRYEPILATVQITNLSGRDLTLHDGELPWFGFDVTGSTSDVLIPPRNPDYKLDPLQLKIGETVKRTVNLTQLYGITEFGIHRIKATVTTAEGSKVFASKPSVVEITEGRTVWQQIVGVPDTLPNAGQMHTITLLEFQDNKRFLYVRVEDKDRGTVFCMYRIGHMIDGTSPQMQFDTANNLYVLHLIGPKTYTLTNIGVNGQFLGQSLYTAPKTRPFLRKLADGTVQIVNGFRENTAATAGTTGAALPPPAKLSDRPPGMPAN